MKRMTQLVAFAGLAGVSLLSAQAATINVAAGLVNPSGSQCSLIEAIKNANAHSDVSGGHCTAGSAGSNTIILATGSTYTITQAYTQVETGTNDTESGLPAITSTIILDGASATIERSFGLGTRCAGGSHFRIFYLTNTGNLSLSDVTLRNGCASYNGTGAGGAIFNQGTLSADLVTLTGNEASQSGGAVHSDGTFTLSRSTVSGNVIATNEAGGGGIVNRGTMTVTQSTISGNQSNGAGGGIDADFGQGQSSTVLGNNTFSGNTSAGNGAALFVTDSPTTVRNVTVAYNQASNGLTSGVHKAGSSSVSLGNTLIANQSGPNCNTGITNAGNNLSDDATCPATVTGDAGIGALSDNGGPTLTIPLLEGSPAISTASAATCAGSPVNGVDQRGEPRPQGAGCDIGAFETISGILTSVRVPTLSEWAVLLLASLVAFFGIGQVRRRRSLLR